MITEYGIDFTPNRFRTGLSQQKSCWNKLYSEPNQVSSDWFRQFLGTAFTCGWHW